MAEFLGPFQRQTFSEATSACHLESFRGELRRKANQSIGYQIAASKSLYYPERRFPGKDKSMPFADCSI